MRVPAALLAVATAALVLGTAAACEPTLRQESGVVISVDSPALGRVDSFELVTSEGETLTFDTSNLRFRREFPASHLAEHKVIGDRIVVTYKENGERLVVTQLDDENHQRSSRMGLSRAGPNSPRDVATPRADRVPTAGRAFQAHESSTSPRRPGRN